MKMKRTPAFLLLALATPAFLGAAPTVTDVTVTPDSERNAYTVSYTLSNAPAIVTFDVLTNDVSIGGAHVRTLTPDDAVNCKIETNGTYSFVWDVGCDWDVPSIGTTNADLVVTAWATNDPPPVAVLGLTAGDPAPLKYYEGIDFLPGGLLSNAAYRTTKLVMKRCETAGKTYTLGSPATTPGYSARNRERTVSFAHDFYIAVFEFTQGQYEAVAGIRKEGCRFESQDWQLRPTTHFSFSATRHSKFNEYGWVYATNEAAKACMYPNAPHPESILGLIRQRTKVMVDLPSENQWEVAARPGDKPYGWNGTPISVDADGRDENFPDRYKFNGGTVFINGEYNINATPQNCDADKNGTAKAGSYKPNDWGVYDMCGNVSEMVLDKYAYTPSTTEAPLVNAGSGQTLIKGLSWGYSALGGFAVHGIQGYHTNNQYCGFRIAAVIE